MKKEFFDKMVEEIKEKGVLIKISGGALAAQSGNPYLNRNLQHIVREICLAYETMENPRIAVVVGGGNIWRGKQGRAFGIRGASSDEIGMLATIINAHVIYNMLVLKLGSDKVRLMLTSTGAPTEIYNREEAKKSLGRGKIVVLGGGIGEPFVSTDYAAVNRAASLELGVVLMAKDGAAGVYDKDPDEGNAKKYATLNYNDFIDAQLQVADGTAIMLARDRLIPLFFFDFSLESILKKIIEGEATGTLVADVPTTFE